MEAAEGCGGAGEISFANHCRDEGDAKQVRMTLSTLKIFKMLTKILKRIKLRFADRDRNISVWHGDDLANALCREKQVS